MKNTKKTKQAKKQDIEIIEMPEDTREYIKDDSFKSLVYTKIMAVIFLVLAIATISFGVMCVIQINDVVQYIPNNVYYPNILLSFFAIINTISITTLFITLFIMGLFDDGTGFDFDDAYQHSACYYD